MRPGGTLRAGANPPAMAQSAAARSRARSRPAQRSRARVAPRPRPGSGGIHWDRVARAAFLVVLAVVVMLYVAPLQHWFQQKQTASEHAAEVQRLEAEHDRLSRRAKELTTPDAIEREARRLGMVKQGERAYVVENLPRE